MQQQRCQIKRFGKNATNSWPWDKIGDGGYIVTRSGVCPSALLIVIANAILMGNCLLHSLKGMVGSDGHS